MRSAMSILSPVVALFLAASGCQAPERIVVQPLPVDGSPAPYPDLLLRARGQAISATEATYTDNWATLGDLANALQQTSKLMPDATAVPEAVKPVLTARAAELGRLAAKLAQAVRKQDKKETDQVLASLHAKIRDLHAVK